ncbi:DUF305 domain-containing protein [Mycolicibacterium lacusdiani]|uniref:DUF305 domain-containing protein n=1 Tax=Mycolicibacterium lacusdiani TaxID=2895283 RepID=UPI001F29B9F7|nr:DUF305 domain-containing protein [Mycolicibacterium lacusdiani]
MGKSKTVVSGMAVLAAVAAIGACSNSATQEAAPSSAPSQTQATESAQAAAHNKADMMFASMMIPHHQQAIEMSDMVLAKQGMDPRVVDLAKQIKDAQGPEIQQMQGWLDDWNMNMNDMPGHGGMEGSGSMMPGMPGMGGMGMMDGMLSAAEMQALRDARGVEADKLFLTGMIKHHEGAITMAQNEIENGEFPEAIELSKAIVESQQKEIDTMNEILKTL